MSQLVSEALAGLRGAADTLALGWSPSRWRRVDADGSERELDRSFTPGGITAIIRGLGELDLTPHERMTLRTTLDVPHRLHGVDVTGDRLELTVRSLYPIEVLVDGEVVLSEPIPPVAAGPALVEAAKSISAEAPGELEITIKPLDGQFGGGVTWLDLVFTTPRVRAKFDILDLAWARLVVADELAATADECAAVESAARLVPKNLLDLGADELASALEAMAPALATLADRVATLDVHVVGHSHIDLAWLWTWDDTREVIKRDVRSVLAIMDDYPEATFTHSQPAGYEVIRAEEPDLFRQLVQRVREGRWEPATAQWVEGDTNLASGEAMASQLLEGVSFSREHLGVTPRVFLAPDTFGHSANMPQLVTDAGVAVYYHMRCNPGTASGETWPSYWWEGLDDTRVLACSTASYNGQLTAGAIARAALDGLRAGLSTSLLFAGVGDHGGGPTRRGYDTLRSVAGAPGMPRARCSTVGAYADQVISSGVRLPVHRGESPRIFEGCYTTHADAKQANRDSENRLGTAETLAALGGLARPPDLTQAWRNVCFHQFHDILDGSGISEVYAKTREDHARVVTTTDDVVDQALAVLTSGIAPGTITVTNPHGHDCTDIVAVPAGTVTRPVLVNDQGESTPGQVNDGKMSFVARAPAFGVAQYRLVEGDADLAVSELTVAWEGDAADGPRYLRVETPHFQVVVRTDCGVITSLVDKRSARQLVAYGLRRPTDYGDAARPDLGLNVFQLVDERPHFMSAWQYQEVHAEHSLIDGATTEVVEHGPVRVVLRVHHRFRASRLTEDIIFYRDLPRIDFVARVDWNEPGDADHGIPNLKVAFTPDLDVCDPWFEIPYGAVRRRSNGQQVPALRWADVGGDDYGVAVLNDSTYAHDVLGNRVRLTLIRTGYLPDPRSDHGEHTFRFSLVPHRGDWRAAGVPHLAATFNQPPVARIEDASTSPPSSTRTPWRPTLTTESGAVSAALRVARDGAGTVVRLAEVTGRAARVTLGGTPDGATVWVSDVTEQRRRRAGVGPDVSVALRPWQVETLLVDES